MSDETVTEPQAYAVYFKSRALFTGLNDETKEILNEKLDLGSRVCLMPYLIIVLQTKT
jgi:hypothetical protein